MNRFLLLLLSVCLIPWTTAIWADSLRGSMLIYQVSEPGQEPYLSRILVSQDFMRMDDGDIKGGGFILFDRKKQTIYSVTEGEETIFVIPPRQLDIEAPEKLERVSNEVATPEPLPRIAGHQPQQFRLVVNGQACYNLATVKTLMPDVVVALGLFRTTLSGEHKLIVSTIPADMRDSCDMALHTFYPTWQLEFGLPIREWDERGNGQILIDYQDNFPIDASWFVLPAHYRHYSSDEM